MTRRSAGPLCLRRRELLAEPGTIVTEVSLNHEFLMSSYNTASERALASVALEMHAGKDWTCSWAGLGLATPREALVSARRPRRGRRVPPAGDRLARLGSHSLGGELKADRGFRSSQATSTAVCPSRRPAPTTSSSSTSTTLLG